MITEAEFFQRYRYTKAEVEAIYQAEARKVREAANARMARAEERRAMGQRKAEEHRAMEEQKAERRETGDLPWAPVILALKQMVSDGAHGLGVELVTFDRLKNAFEEACAQVSASPVRCSRFRVAQAAEQAGIRRLRSPKRLAEGQPTQTVVYSTRNHDQWRYASDEEVRARFRRQAEALNHAPVQIPA